MAIQNLDISKMLPFLEEEELTALAAGAMERENSADGIDLEILQKVMPYLPDYEVDRILYTLMERNIPIESFAPFASKGFFQTLVDLFLAGRAENVKMDALYPFMDKKDIKRLFAAVIAQREMDRVNAQTVFESSAAETAEPEKEENIDELTETIEARVKKRLLTRFFGRDKDISDEVKKQFESAIEE